MTLVTFLAFALVMVLLIMLEVTTWRGHSRCPNCLGKVWTTDLQCPGCRTWFPARSENTLRWPLLWLALVFLASFILTH